MSSGEVLKKVCMVGAAGVGKTSLIRRFVYSTFDDRYISTLGTKISKKTVEIGEKRLTMNIWDIIGQEGYSSLRATYFRGAAGAVAVCDICRPKTLAELIEQLSTLFKIVGPIPLVILSNKADLPEWKIQIQDIEYLADMYSAPYFLTSAKTGEHVDEAFHTLGERMLNGEKSLVPPIQVDELKPSITQQVEEKIFLKFTQTIGDEVLASSLLRQEFERAGADFRNVSSAKMREIVDGLINIIEEYRGKDVANLTKAEFLYLLSKLE